MKNKAVIYTLVIILFGAWLYFLYLYTGHFEFGLVFLAFLGVICSILIIGAVKSIIWRVENGVDLFATLETDPEKLKLKLYMKMLQCQIERFPEVFNDITEETRNYPKWDILGSKMFQSWYKYNVDYMLQHPMNYDLSWLADGNPYIKEKDLYYNFHALPWEETDWTKTSLTE